MNKTLSLLRATLSEGMNIFVYRTRSDKKRHFLPLILALVIFGTLFGSAYYLAADLREDGKQYIVLALFVLMTTVLTIMEGIYKSGSLLFNCRDNDLLLAMPIKKSTITFLRIFKFYVFELIYNSIFLGPAILAYALNADIGPSFILVAVVMLLFLPVIPVAISSVLGVANTAFAARFKRSAVVEVVVSLLLLGLALAAVLMLSWTQGPSTLMVEEIGEKVVQLYYPAAAFVSLVTNFEVGGLVVFILVNLAVFAALVMVVGKFYFQIVNRVSVIKRVAKERPLKFARRSQTRAMLKKELTKYFNTPVLVTNTAVGLVMFLIAVVAVCLKFDELAAMLAENEFPLGVEEIRAYLPSIAFAMVAFTSLMTFITTTMFSLEGRAFNILKTLPISGRKVILTKVLAAVLLIAPVTLLGTMVLAIKFQFGVVELILLLAAIVLVPLVTEMVGILIDLKYARFDAESDAEIVKQSPGVMISSFLGLIAVIVTISLTFAVVFLCGQIGGLLIMDGVFLVIFLFLLMAILAQGEQKYLRLSA
ncbi:hypothetical protein IKF73_01510 [Candidatus Saccharibacteria bacterium]|nr:hypothetical protein [Candidatus Saccharibacteria bacterium]